MPNITQEVLSLYSNRPKVAILMSGAGSNAEALLGSSDVRDLYDIRTIVTDKTTSRASEIAENHDVGLLAMPQGRFEKPQDRSAYFNLMGRMLGNTGIQAAFYAGFMKITTPDFIRQFPGVNVHPANLTVLDENGKAKYRGMHAISDMHQELGYVQSTVHIVDTEVDSGTAISVSPKVYPLSPEESDQSLHSRLKVYEHRIFPATLAMLGQGALTFEQMPLMMEDS